MSKEEIEVINASSTASAIESCAILFTALALMIPNSFTRVVAIILSLILFIIKAISTIGLLGTVDAFNAANKKERN